MPRFNMSDEEAQSLANYFAAVDGAPFPYQRIPQQEPPYLAEREADFHAMFGEENTTYLHESWLTLNAPLCIKCHSLGGREYKVSDPKTDVHAPNLDRVAQRLRPDYLNLWLRKPKAFLPYTSMPTNFPRNQQQFPELFDTNQHWQNQGVADALLNYYNLMEQYGVTVYTPPGTPVPAEQPAADQAAAADTATSTAN
jgi:hypothetical protein